MGWFSICFKDIAWTLFTGDHWVTPEYALRLTFHVMSEPHFKIKLGRIHASDGHRKFIRLVRNLRYGSAKLGSSRRGYLRGGKKTPSQYFQRRVIVKFSLVKMNAQGRARQAQHLDYIARDSAAPENQKENDKFLDTGLDEEHDKSANLFNRDGRNVDVESFKAAGADDPHQFRIIISPEDSHRLESLEHYSRDLMRQMEQDMGTKLDWVGAAHFDTANPHVHIVLRGAKDNGKRLLIPRRYIAYGLREQAERLISLELGPMQVREAGQKLARQVTQGRLTGLDRALLKAADKSIIDLGASPAAGESWTRRLDIARLKHLASMGLAQKLSSSQWQLLPNMEKTLRQMGDRGDILKAYHKALKQEGMTRNDLGNIIYDPSHHSAETIIGKIIRTGVRDDVNDKAYTIVDTTSGQPVYVPMGGAENIEGLQKDDIIEISPNRYAPKPSDLNIETIAAGNGGIYDLAAHMKHDPSARPKFMEAHVRRLEALRRLGIVARRDDGSWKVPNDYLKQVETIETRKLLSRPVQSRLLARGQLKAMSKIIGRTWLDQQLAEPSATPGRAAFGTELRSALQSRRQFLSDIGIMGPDDIVTSKHLDELEKRDLSEAGGELEKSLGKSFKPLPERGTVKGVYAEMIERPSGKYVLIERSKEFSLVPWREVMEKRRGMEISGRVSRGRVNWNIGRSQEITIT